MVQPTITSVTPDTSLFIGGSMVKLVGTDFIVSDDAFQFDYDPGDTGMILQKVPGNDPIFPTPLPLKRMLVEILANATAYKVESLVIPSTTEMSFVMPRIHAVGNTAHDRNYSLAVDIRITPLDSLGDPVPGDILTEVAALTLELPKTGLLASGKRRSPHSIITKKLVEDFRSFIDAQTRVLPHVDYEKLGVAILRSSTMLPATIIVGPESERPILGSKPLQRLSVQGVGDEVLQTRSYDTRDLIFDVFQLDYAHLNLADAMNDLEAYVGRTQYFVYEIFPDSPNPVKIISTLLFERTPGLTSVPSLLPSSVRQSFARLRITSVPVGMYANVAQDARVTTYPHTATHLIHQTSGSASDEQPDNSADIIEDENS